MLHFRQPHTPVSFDEGTLKHNHKWNVAKHVYYAYHEQTVKPTPMKKIWHSAIQKVLNQRCRELKVHVEKLMMSSVNIFKSGMVSTMHKICRICLHKPTSKTSGHVLQFYLFLSSMTPAAILGPICRIITTALC